MCFIKLSEASEAASKFKNHCSKGLEHTEKHSCHSVTGADLLKRLTAFFLYYSFHTFGSLSSAFISRIQWMGLLPVLASACKGGPHSVLSWALVSLEMESWQHFPFENYVNHLGLDLNHFFLFCHKEFQ